MRNSCPSDVFISLVPFSVTLLVSEICLSLVFTFLLYHFVFSFAVSLPVIYCCVRDHMKRYGLKQHSFFVFLGLFLGVRVSGRLSGCASGCSPLPGEQLEQVVRRRGPWAVAGRVWAAKGRVLG